MGGDRDALSKNLMNVLGFDSMLESVREESIKMAQGQMDKMVSQIKQSNPKIDNETMKELDAANKEFINRIVNSWSSGLSELALKE
jgi:hypothetical protein